MQSLLNILVVFKHCNIKCPFFSKNFIVSGCSNFLSDISMAQRTVYNELKRDTLVLGGNPPFRWCLLGGLNYALRGSLSMACDLCASKHFFGCFIG